jgi:uncharacterized protein (TIGR02246 family)
MLIVLFGLGWAGLLMGESQMDAKKIDEFASRYAEAWCSQDAASVAAFFAPDGSLTINDGEPSVGTMAIAAVARGFMTAFPDMIVELDSVDRRGEVILFHWTLTGTNTGPGGTGNPVRISGYEEWTFSDRGLIQRSLGHYDAQEYQRQLEHGLE